MCRRSAASLGPSARATRTPGNDSLLGGSITKIPSHNHQWVSPCSSACSSFSHHYSPGQASPRNPWRTKGDGTRLINIFSGRCDLSAITPSSVHYFSTHLTLNKEKLTYMVSMYSLEVFWLSSSVPEDIYLLYRPTGPVAGVCASPSPSPPVNI